MEWNGMEVIVATDDSRSSMAVDKIDCSQAFLHSLSKTFKSDSFSDVTLQVGDVLYPAHKSFLAASSPYFQRMFYGGDWRERNEQQVKLKETPDCQKVFADFLQYFYTGCVSVNRQTVVPLVTLADKYNVQVLKDHCSQYMINVVNSADIDGSVAWLAFAEQISVNSLAERCYDIICLNFEKACSLPVWSTLSYEQVLTILQRTDVVVPNEYTLYMGIHNWIQTNECAVQKLGEILSYIHFKNMTADELLQVEKSRLANTGGSQDQINAHVLQAFRHVAISNARDEGSTIISEDRIYTSDGTFQKDRFVDGCAPLCPSPRKGPKHGLFLINSFNRFQWRLEKSLTTGAFVITMLSKSMQQLRQVRALQQRQVLENTVHVDLVILFRDHKGTVHFSIIHSADTVIPYQNGGVLVELPSPSHLQVANNLSEMGSTEMHSLFVPDEILYSFRITHL